MFCTHCAALIASHTDHCAQCGEFVATEPAPCMPPAVSEASSPRQPTKTSMFVAPFALVLIVAAWFSWNVVDNRRSEMEAYSRAKIALDAGNYSEAITYFTAAGGYRDAAELRTQAQQQLAPVRAAWLDALSAIDREDYDLAVSLLEPIAQTMPTFEQAATLLDAARAGQLRSLERQVDVALIHADWMSAEYLLQDLIRLDPANAEYRAELKALRNQHAPILFERAGRLYQIGPNGQDEQLLYDDSPATRPLWSPDRRFITFLDAASGRSLVGSLFLLNVKTGEVTLISDTASTRSLPVWDAETHQLAFSSSAPPGLLLYDLESASLQSLYAIAPDMAGLTQITSPSWSPEADQLAFIASSASGAGDATLVADVYRIDLRTGTLENLTVGALPFVASVSWSPGANQLLTWQKQGGTVWFEGFETSINLIDLDMGTMTRLTERTEVTGPPVWSFDGRAYGVVANDGVVVLRSLEGIEIAVVESRWTLSGFLTWSPNGNALLASPANPADPSLLVALEDSTESMAWIEIAFEWNAKEPGPQWSALTAVPGLHQ